MSEEFKPTNLAKANKEKVAADVIALKEEWIHPHLNVILAWSDESSRVYANTKKKVWELLGIEVTLDIFPDDVTEEELEEIIVARNNNPTVHGIILESPLPEWMNYDRLLSKVWAEKDVDGLGEHNLWKILTGRDDGILPATPQACVDILNELTETIRWLKIAIVWHWKTVWWPLSSMLSNMWATVTVCNSKTRNLQAECVQCDVIITAVWRAWLIKKEMVNENTIIIDAWMNVNSEWKLSWDTDYDEVSEVAGYVTPVPWGVGPVTTSLIFKNLIRWITLQKEKNDPFDIQVNDLISLSKWAGMPWGWSISAMSAIHGVSMISMVFSLTKWLEHSYDNAINWMIDRLKDLYVLDSTCFNEYLTALRLPRGTEERTVAIQEALKKCCEVPLQIAEVCLEVLELASECYKVWNKNVLSDAVVWVNLAIAAANSALEPLEMNLSWIKDSEYVNWARERRLIINNKLSNFNLKD